MSSTRKQSCNDLPARPDSGCMAIPREPEDLLFARYRKRGDPDLRAQVFDHTAARLLRLAFHLSRDPAEAEDLVQATFVTAIEKAGQFDTDRSVLPWLTGILENHAREARISAFRRIVPERLATGRSPLPRSTPVPRNSMRRWPGDSTSCPSAIARSWS